MFYDVILVQKALQFTVEYMFYVMVRINKVWILLTYTFALLSKALWFLSIRELRTPYEWI